MKLTKILCFGKADIRELILSSSNLLMLEILAFY